MRHLLLPLLCVLVASPSLFSQTQSTGALTGRVHTAGEPLANVEVTVRSSSLPGVRETRTNDDGEFRFTLLPPGQYELTAKLVGFATLRSGGIAVPLGQTVTNDVTMTPSTSQEVEVVASRPVVDVTSTASAVNITGEAITALPMGRNYTAAEQLAPGAARDSRGATFYGASSAENLYVIDGINVSEPNYGTNDKSVMTSFIDEVQVLSGGLNAEYGRVVGGMVNAVTKSGSNQLAGSLFGYYELDRSSPAYISQLSPNTFDYRDTDESYDGGLEIGGPVLADRLWFYGGFDRTESQESQTIRFPLQGANYSYPVGHEFKTKVEGEVYTGKLTWTPLANHLVTASIFGDPRRSAGVLRPVQGPPTTFEGTRESGGDDYALRYSAIFGSRWQLDSSFGRHLNNETVDAIGADIPRVFNFAITPRTAEGGFGQYFETDSDRRVARLDGTLMLGNHAVKAGIDQDRGDSIDSVYYSGADRLQIFCRGALVGGQCPAETGVYYVHTTFVDVDTFDPKDPSTYFTSVINPHSRGVRNRSNSAYLQDSWSLSSFNFNAGLRFDRQVIYYRDDEELFTLTDPALRLGAVWDAGRDGRQKLYAFAGRYNQLTGTDVGWWSGFAYNLQVANLDPTAGNFTPDPNAPAFSNGQRYQYTGGGRVEGVDPDLRTQYTDEFILGYDVRMARNFTVGVKGTHREVGRVIDNVNGPDGSIQANPGYGLGRYVKTLSGAVVPLPKPERRFNGLELHATKHYSGGSQLYASYLWSRLYGTYEGVFQESTDYYSNPPTNTYAEQLVHADGVLPADRTHQLKLHGSYRLKNGFARGLDLGIGTYWMSGVPLTAYGFSRSTFTHSYMLTERGALGRGPSQYEADLRFGYPIHVAGRAINLSLDVLNVLDRQKPTALDETYNTFGAACSGIPAALCNGDGGLAIKPGTLEPIGELPDPRATATNPQFLSPVAWSPQRSIRLAVRWAF